MKSAFKDVTLWARALELVLELGSLFLFTAIPSIKLPGRLLPSPLKPSLFLFLSILTKFSCSSVVADLKRVPGPNDMLLLPWPTVMATLMGVASNRPLFPAFSNSSADGLLLECVLWFPLSGALTSDFPSRDIV